jgi:hypothetical protein
MDKKDSFLFPGNAFFENRFSPPAVDQVLNSRQGMFIDHPGAGIPHHLLYPLPHGRGITMHSAFPAGGFPFAKAALIKALQRIIQQSRAFITQFAVAMITLAIYSYHFCDGTGFSSDAWPFIFHIHEITQIAIPGASGESV